MSLVATVKRARKTAGLSLTEVAERSGLQVSNLSAIEAGKREPRAETLDRVVQASKKRFIAVPGGPQSAAEIAEEIDVQIQRGWKRDLFRFVIQLSDNLVAAEGVTASYALVLETPDSTGDWELDAAIAGVVAYRFEQRGFPIPDWVSATILESAPPLEQLSWVGMPEKLQHLQVDYTTNSHFTCRGVFVALEDLASV